LSLLELDFKIGEIGILLLDRPLRSLGFRFQIRVGERKNDLVGFQGDAGAVNNRRNTAIWADAIK